MAVTNWKEKTGSKMRHCLLLLALSSSVSVATAQSWGAFYNPDFVGGVGCGVVDLGSATAATYKTQLTSTLLVSFDPFCKPPESMLKVVCPIRILTRHTIRSCPTAQTRLWKRHVRMRRHRPPTAQEVPTCSSIFL